MASLKDTSITGTLSATGAVTLSAYGAGFVKFNASGAITMDTSTYLTAITSILVTNALGFTPYNATNPSGYITSSGSISGNAANVSISNLNTQQVTVALAAGSWYTIAANAGDRASAKFTITDGTSGLHQAIHFYASAHFGTYTGSKISVISNTYYSGPPISGIRTMIGSTYDGAMVQVYAQNACTITVSIYDNQQTNGWVIKSGIISTTNPGTVATYTSLTTVAAQVDTGSGKIFSFTGDLYIGGTTTQYLALHTGNYNSYAPTLTGNGASGTWGINVSGTAASISGFNNPTTAATANTIAYRDGSGDLTVRELVMTQIVQSFTPSSMVAIYPTTNQAVKVNAAGVQAFLGLGSLAYSSATIPTNNNQLTNGAGYITGYSETDTLATVTARGATTSTAIVSSNNIQATQFRSYLDGSDTISGGGMYIANAANNRAFNTQLSADGNSLKTFGYGGSSWSSVIYTLTNAGAATFASTISASNFSGSHSGTSSGTNTGDQTNISGYSTYLATAYAGGQQTNPQVYFNNGVGLKAAMTGAWSVWSDTLWINGYSGGDVLQMCALHTLRNGTPRMAISVQASTSTSYGAFYEFITAYNIGSQSVSNATTLAGYGWASSGKDVRGTEIYTDGWLRNYNVNTGLYNQSSGNHFYSGTASIWNITAAGNSSVRLQFRTTHESTIFGSVYGEAGNIGFLANDGNWGLRVDASHNVFTYGTDLTVGNSTNSNIYMTDTDEGTRRIHCNSGRIGFLNSSNGWGAWNDNTGNWRTDFSMYATSGYFYASGGVRLGDMWSGNGLYVPSGQMVFGTESSNGWSFQTGAVQKAYFGGDGNLTTAGGYYTNAGMSTNAGGALSVKSPGGASRANGASTEYGAFRIKLPAGIPVYGMFKLVIHIYEYGQRGNGYEIHCGGHMYPNYMYNRFQVQYGTSNSPLNVRYGNDGSTGCIWIGDLGTTWSYPQIWVSEFLIGYSNTSWTTWRSGWSITLDNSSYGNSGAMDGPYTCDFGYAATASQVTVNYNDNSNANYQLLWGSGNSIYGTGDVYVNPYTDVINARGGFISTSNPWGTANSAYFPNGISTAGGDNWIYGHTYIGNAPSNGSGHEFWSDGHSFHRSSTATSSQGASARFVELQSANGNFIPYSFESDRGNHSWGTVARFRINNGESDRPSIQFSWGGSDNRWNVGYCYADDNFRITQNMGYRNDNSTYDGWGTERFKIDTSGNITAGGTITSAGGTMSGTLNMSGNTLSNVYQITHNNAAIKMYGNFHLDAYNGNTIYLQYYNPGATIQCYASIAMNGYSISNANTVNAATFTGALTGNVTGNVTGNASTATGQQSSTHFTLNTGGPGYGLVGVYNPDVHQGLFAMGPAYTLAAGGTLANFYGVSWSYDYSGRQLNTGYNLQHCMAVSNAGTVATVIGLGIWTNGLIRANGAISAGGTITSAGIINANGGIQMGGQVLGFDQSGVRSWNIQATGGNLKFGSGDNVGGFTFNGPVYQGAANQGVISLLSDVVVSQTNNYFRLYLPQGYVDNRNGGTATIKIVWGMLHAGITYSQEYKLTFGTNHGAGGNYLVVSEVTRTYKDQNPQSYGGYLMDQTPAVDFYQDYSGGYINFNVKGYHGYNSHRVVSVDIVGGGVATPTLTYYGETSPGGSALTVKDIPYATTAGSAPNGSNINNYYDTTAGNGYGFRFWNGSDAYKISMGASALYYYGPVTDYSIKTQMNDGDTGRGFTWGRTSYAPIAAINSTSGNMQIAGTFYAEGNIASVVAADVDVITSINTSASYYHACFVGSIAAVGSTSSYYLYGQQNTSSVSLKIFTNGNIENTNNSYGAISDIRLKENIKDATPKLEDLMKVKVRNYNLIGESNKQLGVISQELEAIFPNMIQESTNMGESMKIKGVKYSVFIPMLIKAIQEQQIQIEELKNKLDEFTRN